ncbi:cell adhesion molecule-related/down-regulated by oncogenes-like isoform X2 [Anguilla anguilla]|uniref:cell adhesion molecule-related/down-regulated by oncogenes-like isoform X2 n=1 Tax=Anguilla anguilla TaxID=7936 RepID=UPI0015AD4024|nr:cell adhesion molecule-related/down-regulated by oncogenes-like isoform X2 [Anguilla anguilla]
MDFSLRVLSTVLYLCQALLVCCLAVPLSFRSEPLSAAQRQGGAVHLLCSARPPSARLSWRFMGRALEPGAGAAAAAAGVRVRSGSLTVPSLQPDQAGLYQCVAQTDAGAIASRPARVTIAGISEFGESQKRSLAVEEGGTALVECRLPHSDPPALPRLRVRGEWLEQSADEYLILPSGNLQIVSVSPRHQGTYKCGAYNPVTREAKVEGHGTRLIVKRSDGSSQVRIVFPVTPQTLNVVRSKPLTLECVLAGRPNLIARWVKDGQDVVLGPSHTLVHNNLLLTSVKQSDAGNYKCLVPTEKRDVVSANYTVNVLEPPSVLRGLSDQSVTSGSSTRFVCAAKGSPAPNITWLFNANPVVPSSRHQVSGSSLRIAAVTSQDQGVYQCLLDNGVGWAQSAGTLTVQSGPSSRPVILSPPLSGSFQEGDDVFLSCNASGQPLPVIRWYNAAGPIATHPARLLQPPQAAARAPGDSPPHLTMSRPGSSSLYIQAVTPAHAGKYICEASNELGSVKAEAILTVEPLESTSAGTSTDSTLSIHPIQNDEGEEPFLQEEEPGEGHALPSERTSDLPPPEAPIITSPPQTHKPDVYDLEWRPGRDWSSPINAYFVKYRKLDDAGNVAGGWHTVRVPGSEKTLRLSELEPSSLYEVLMVARSSAGEGQPAMLTFRTGKERISPSKNPSKPPILSLPDSSNTHFGVVVHDTVPEAPDRPTISMATESSVYVTWIPRANGGSPITAFRVEYRRQGRSAEWATAADNISPLKLSVEVRNLEPGSTYRFRVIAVNMYGESPHSTPSRPYPVSAVSPPFSNRPVAGPHISSTDAVSDTQIMLRWTYTPSSNNNTPIQGFYIYYRPTDSDNDSDYKRDVVEGIKQWHLIGQLQPETSYDIKMQCFNDGGESEYSNVMICETKARLAPGAPPQSPVTPPGPYPPDPPSAPGGLLYLIVGSVLGVMVLILLVFIAMCLWRNRQQSGLHKYDPPGYLYQPAEMNGHVLEYTTLPGTSRVNGGVHGGYGHGGGGMAPPGCPHLHHKLPNGLALLNGTGGLYAPAHNHGHDGALPHAAVDYEHPHPHPHPHNGGGMYTALPQSDPSDCMSCQNFCNNNRCFTKANASFSNGSLPMMHRGAPCQPDGLEMVPLGHVTPRCHTPSVQQCVGEESAKQGEESEEDKALPLSQHSCCQAGECQHYQSEERDEEPPQQEEQEQEQEKEQEEPEPVSCWERLSLSDLDCNEKAGWVSTAIPAGGLIQTPLQET